jgi:hypothetical protein
MRRVRMRVQAYLLMRVDKPGAELGMPGTLLETTRATWINSTKKARPLPCCYPENRMLGE